MDDVTLFREGIGGLFYINIAVAVYIIVRAYRALCRDNNQHDSRPYVVPLFMCVAFLVLSVITRPVANDVSDSLALGLFFCWQLFHCVMLVAVSVLVHGIERTNNERFVDCPAGPAPARCMGLDCSSISGVLHRGCCLRCRREVGGRRKQDNPDNQG